MLVKTGQDMSERPTSSRDPFRLADEMGFGDIHFKTDPRSGLHAIVAIHNTNLGPALGGCRFVAYASTGDALYDAMRLAQGMSYKAAMAGLQLGGGKAVIMRPPRLENREALFATFGDFVDELGGRYITAVDSGTSVADMDIIATRTRHVASTSAGERATGDPSPYTAYGVFRAIEAAVRFKYGRDELDNIHVVIQGVGHVGYHLAKLLHQARARLSYCDVNQASLQRVMNEFGGAIIAPDEIFDTACDVFAPCALGGVLDSGSVSRLNAAMVVGAANNQLATPEAGALLKQRNILYAPDYVVNAGGLIQIALVDDDRVRNKIDEIDPLLTELFRAAAESGDTTAAVADNMARQRIAAAGG
jgi:leucine dehydrogenase